MCVRVHLPLLFAEYNKLRTRRTKSRIIVRSMPKMYVFEREVEQLRKYASENDISESEMKGVFEECFKILEVRTTTRIRVILRLLGLISITLFLSILSTFVLYNHPQTHSLLLRNVQDLIYPGLRTFRKLAVPIITQLPFLTDWYDEWCLVENPYFFVDEMDCSPCSNINSIQDLTSYNISSALNSGTPFMWKEKQDAVNMKKLYEFYETHKSILDSDMEQARLAQIFHGNIGNRTEKECDESLSSRENVHIKWRINRMEPGRELRKIFSGPCRVPDWWSPSTEKFILIDQAKVAAYSMPNPECANVIIQCKTGERLIELNPSPECSQNCRKLSVTLKARQSLSYNWWYWRPTSLPTDNATGTTIMYLTSYC